jgi:glycosyltransferase involved in cell wall biosynthesis
MSVISFVIPVFRNEGSLLPTFNKINSIIKSNPNFKTWGTEFIFVNDGSDDNSELELQKLFNSNNNVSIISFSRNFGQVPALIAGYRYAKGEVVCNISADLQDPPALIINMLELIQNGNHIAIGTRIDREDGFLNNATSNFFYGLMSKVLPNMPKGGFDFVMMSRKAVNEFNKIDERNRFFQGDILWLGFSICWLPYKREKRTIGKSQWTLGKKLKYFIDGMLNTSYLPIRLMSLIGVITSLIGFLYALLIIYLRIFYSTPFTGWAPIMVIILIIGGLIMLMLGIIGEYIWRIYDESRGRDVYVIRDIKENE